VNPRGARTAVAAALLAAGVALVSAVAAEERIVHLERSEWQTIVVSDSETRRCLRFGEGRDALSQSCLLLAQPEHLAFDYTRAMVAVFLLWQPAPQRVLLIGVGGGSVPTALRAVRPEIDIDAVDIDAGVLRVAQRYFGLAPGPQLRLHAADGREFVAAARAQNSTYDAVLLDAFDAEGIPAALFSADFLRDVRALLNPGGIFLANTLTASVAHARESATAQQAFGRFYEVKVGVQGGNRLIVAAASPSQLPAPRALKAGLAAQRDALARLGIHEAWVRQLDFGDRRSVAP
jgi:spermidine synthase